MCALYIKLRGRFLTAAPSLGKMGKVRQVSTIRAEPLCTRSPLHPLNFQDTKSLFLVLTMDSSLHFHRGFFVPSLVHLFIHSFFHWGYNLRAPFTFKKPGVRDFISLLQLVTLQIMTWLSTPGPMRVAQGHVDSCGPEAFGLYGLSMKDLSTIKINNIYIYTTTLTYNKYNPGWTNV